MGFDKSGLRTRRQAFFAVICAGGGSVLLAGCGGGGSSSSNSPQIRAINTIANGGNGTISVNGAAVSGSQGYFGVTTYQSLGSASSLVTYSLSTSSGASYPSLTENLLVGGFYSLILVGRADVTSTADPRYPTVLETSDIFTTPSTGQTLLRVIHAAPDAGKVDVFVNGLVAVSGAAYKSISNDVIEPSGNVTVQINNASAGTTLVAPQTITLTAGHVYTLFVLEPTVTPTPVFAINETDDTSIASPTS